MLDFVVNRFTSGHRSHLFIRNDFHIDQLLFSKHRFDMSTNDALELGLQTLRSILQCLQSQCCNRTLSKSIPNYVFSSTNINQTTPLFVSKILCFVLTQDLIDLFFAVLAITGGLLTNPTKGCVAHRSLDVLFQIKLSLTIHIKRLN